MTQFAKIRRPPILVPILFDWQSLSRQVASLSQANFNHGHLPSSVESQPPTIIVGAGIAGQELALKLLKKGHAVVLINGESVPPYNRAIMSSHVAAGGPLSELIKPGLQGVDPTQLTLLDNTHVAEVKPQEKQIRLTSGQVLTYQTLVLATGSYCHIADELRDLKSRVYAFRNIADLGAIAAVAPRRVIVLGGGLLGIEAARALACFCEEIVIVERSAHLLPRQLDGGAALLLQALLYESGIKVITLASLIEASETDVEVRIVLQGGRELSADLLVYATGVIPNTALARSAGLKTNKGIVVDARLQTSDPHIFAIGECVEQQGETFSSLAPCIYQANVLGDYLTGEEVRRAQNVAVFQLKLGLSSVISMGRVSVVRARKTVYEKGKKHYRALFIEDGLVQGAVIFDRANVDCSQFMQAIEGRRKLSQAELLEFTLTGNIPPISNSHSTQIVCFCANVSDTQITNLRERGFDRPYILATTKATTYCGSCSARVDTLLQVRVKNNGNALPLVTATLVVALCLAFVTGMSMPYADRWLDDYRFVDALWRHSVLQQWSGYFLLCIVLLAAGWGYRRRIGRMKTLKKPASLPVHLLLSTLAMVLWYAHTGGKSGYYLNHWLFVSFVLIMLGGVAVSTCLRLANHNIRYYRLLTGLRFLHWLALFPFPVLLAFHIIKTYFF